MVKDSIALGSEAVLERARWLRSFGVALLDVGGRSITPDAPMIDDAQEQARLRPAVESLKAEGYAVSVDTWSAATAIEAVAWGADWINFTGEALSPAMLRAAAGAGATLALTYMPYGDAYQMRSRERIPYRIQSILDFMRPRIAQARDSGISRVVVDPNLGIIHASTDDYTKIHLQLEVLARTHELRALGCPLLYYAARKPERLARIMLAEAVLRAAPDVVRTHEPEIIRELQAARSESLG